MDMLSNVRRFDNSCQEVWTTDTQVFKCLTCDSSQQSMICENCFRNGRHNEHNYEIITNFNGFCSCGDASGLVFCTDHQKLLRSDISKPLHLSEFLLKEFIETTGVDSNEAKYLVYLNQIRKILNQSNDEILVKNYFQNSQTEEQMRNIEINNIYSVYRKDHEKRFVDCSYAKQRRLLLWHGTTCANLTGILRHGFKLSNKENLMFGNGIYFADRVTKSCNYCDQTGPGFLILCEVSLGEIYNTDISKPYSSAPDKYDSIKGLGKYVPDSGFNIIFDDSIEVPIGKTIENKHPNIHENHNLNFNEYVVFDPKRILLKFIIHFNWF